MYGGFAYGTAPYAGGESGTVAPVTPVIARNALGRDRRGTALVTVTVPVAALPAGLVRAQKVDKALAYPTPVLVDGRPT